MDEDEDAEASSPLSLAWLRYWMVTVILLCPWTLVINHYSQGGRWLFGSRIAMVTSVVLTLVTGAVGLALVAGRLRGLSHAIGLVLFFGTLLAAFGLASLLVAVAGHLITSTPFPVETVPFPLRAVGSLYFVLLTALGFTIVHWYTVIPLVAVSYALLCWAGPNRQQNTA